MPLEVQRIDIKYEFYFDIFFFPNTHKTYQLILVHFAIKLSPNLSISTKLYQWYQTKLPSSLAWDSSMAFLASPLYLLSPSSLFSFQESKNVRLIRQPAAQNSLRKCCNSWNKLFNITLNDPALDYLFHLLIILFTPFTSTSFYFSNICSMLQSLGFAFLLFPSLEHYSSLVCMICLLVSFSSQLKCHILKDVFLTTWSKTIDLYYKL